MSTKTTFKRIALVAATSLGLGIMSMVPSQGAVLAGTASLTSTNGSATYGTSDSTTAASYTLSYTATAADTAVVSFINTSKPSTATAPYITGYYRTTDTLAASTYATGADTTSTTGASTVKAFRTNTDVNSQANPLTTRTGSATISGSDTHTIAAVANTRTVTKFLVYMDSTTGTRLSGTYTYDVVANLYGAGAGNTGLQQILSTSISFTVALPTSNSLTVNAGNSSAVFSADGSGTTDEVVSALATASSDPAGVINVKLRNSSNNSTAQESVTVTTTLGTVGVPGGTFGRSVVLAYASGIDSLTVYLRPDGNAGAGSITVSVPSVTFANKSVNFYAAAPKTLTAASLISVVGGGSTSAALSVKAVDANGIAWAGTLYTYSSDATVISNSATSCSYNSTNQRHECAVTGVANGTATITVRDAATVATSTVASSAISFTVNTNAPASVKIAWDKASYAPGEKATLAVSAYDSSGKLVRGQTLTNIFATGGISLNIAGGSGSDTTSAVTFATSSLASASPAYSNTDPIKTYTIYMPYSGGTVTASATGGTGLPLSGQVAISATATVADSGAQALAAVTALASQVSAFITKINAQITTLTDLVMKIQKKVKA